MANKNFVLDTNVLLHDPNAIDSFQDNNVFIPMIVLEELDKFKKNENETGRNSRSTARLLDEYREKGSLSNGVKTKNGGNLQIISSYHNCSHLDMTINDNKILAVAQTLHKEKGDTVLVTNDINLRIKADTLGIPSEKFGKKKSESNFLYKGYKEIRVPQEMYSSLSVNKWVSLTDEMINELDIYPNIYLKVFKEDTGSSIVGRFCGEDKKIKRLISGLEAFGTRALSEEQFCALDALLNDNIKLVSLVGKAGTGKTLLAIAAGLQKIVNETKYSKLLVSRPIMPMGNDIGYLPGDLNEKLAPWMQPIKDNLDFLFDLHNRHTQKDKKKENKKDKKAKKDHGVTPDEPKNIQERLMQEGVLQVEALTYIRGRSIPNQYMIIDEAQNLTPHEIKTIITRAGEGTKIVLTGDTQQIDSPYLDELSNGLAYCVERMKGENISAHITLTQGERSALAEAGSKLL